MLGLSGLASARFFVCPILWDCLKTYIMNLLLLAAFLGSFFVNKPDLSTPPPPPPSEIVVVKSYIGEVTAYTSREEETDSTPFIGAQGTEVHWGIVATNAYPFGTKIRFPEAFGTKVFTVTDRMHTRYKNRIDIWFPEHERALHFGVQNTQIEIVKDKPKIEVAVK